LDAPVQQAQHLLKQQEELLVEERNRAPVAEAPVGSAHRMMI
jgi:hypothetical protein